MGKESKKESVPKEPILIIPFKGGDYPRVEVFVDSHGTTIGVRDDPQKNLRNVKYGSTKPSSFMPIVNDLLLLERMLKGRKSDYDASFKSFVDLYREHCEFIENLIVDFDIVPECLVMKVQEDMLKRIESKRNGDFININDLEEE